MASMGLLSMGVEKLLEVVEGSGCEEGEVVIRRNPDAPRCQFEEGVVIEALFGGRSGEVSTGAPLQARTRISFMKGAVLQDERERSAALAILNATTAFLCISRRVHSCSPDCHARCLRELKERVASSRVSVLDEIPLIEESLAGVFTQDVKGADLVLVNAGDLITKGREDVLERMADSRKVLLLGPSLGGIASLLGLPHWCPYGR